MKLRLIANSTILELKDLYSQEEQEEYIKSLEPQIRKIAYLKSRGSERDPKFDTGLVNRFTPDDEDDLHQIGMMAVWQAINNNESKSSRYTLLMIAKSAMNRGGSKDMRVVGDMPYVGSASAAADHADIAHGSDVDPDSLPASELDPGGKSSALSQAIKDAELTPKQRKYMELYARGFGVTDIGKQCGVSKVAAHQGIKKAIGKIRDILEIPKPDWWQAEKSRNDEKRKRRRTR